ncbi:DNA polymerase III subunit chi [Orientia tsutsugamushi]|uniref:DNA polymerase III subunit chi n=1 Tax=Orientia tsutsugamushi TaxID=784 RepID=UPI002FCC55F1
MNNTLWSFSSTSFIPHGCSTDPEPSSQPIYITTNYENPNQAKIKAYQQLFLQIKLIFTPTF